MSGPSSAQTTSQTFEVTEAEKDSLNSISQYLKYLTISDSEKKSMRNSLAELSKGTVPTFEQHDDNGFCSCLPCLSSGGTQNTLPTVLQLRAISNSRSETTQDVNNAINVITRLNRHIIMEARSSEDKNRPDSDVSDHQKRERRHQRAIQQEELKRQRMMKYSQQTEDGEPTSTVEQPPAPEASIGRHDWAQS